MAISPFLRDCTTGACVGVTDIALVYPLAVIATRRENGLPLLAAIKQGRFWAGGLAIRFRTLRFSFLIFVSSLCVSVFFVKISNRGRMDCRNSSYSLLDRCRVGIQVTAQVWRSGRLVAIPIAWGTRNSVLCHSFRTSGSLTRARR